jgi:hypothetical protein
VPIQPSLIWRMILQEPVAIRIARASFTSTSELSRPRAVALRGGAKRQSACHRLRSSWLRGLRAWSDGRWAKLHRAATRTAPGLERATAQTCVAPASGIAKRSCQVSQTWELAATFGSERLPIGDMPRRHVSEFRR